MVFASNIYENPYCQDGVGPRRNKPSKTNERTNRKSLDFSNPQISDFDRFFPFPVLAAEEEEFFLWRIVIIHSNWEKKEIINFTIQQVFQHERGAYVVKWTNKALWKTSRLFSH